MIYIHKGDDTIFGPQDKFLTFILNTDLDLTGWKAKFKLDGFIIYVHDISSKQFEIILTHHMTVQLPLGEIYGSITLIDDKQQVRTITNSIPFEVTCEVVENQYETVDLTIPEPSDVEVKLRVGGQAVYSVNGKTGEVVITAEDVGAISEDALIPLATYDYVNTNINNTQLQIDDINLELDNTNARLNQKAEISYVDRELSRKADINDLNSKANVSAIPTRVSQLVNDKGYITEHQDISNKADLDYVEDLLTYKADKTNTYTKVEVDTLIDEKQDVGEYALISDIPTKVSQLNNDTGYISYIPDEYITEDEVYTRGETDVLLSTKQPSGDYALLNQIPTLVSQLKNDTKFITLDDVTGLIPPTQPFTISVVDVLPSKGESGIIYLIPKDEKEKDIYKEYIWIEDSNSFELIGTTAVDLTNYVKNTNYATSTTAGVIKTAPVYGTQTDSTGRLLGSIQSLDQYNSFTNNGLVSKGTLENVKNDYVKRGITANNISLTTEEKASAQSWLGLSEYVTETELNSKNYITEGKLETKGYITKEDLGDVVVNETDPIYTSDKPNIVFKNKISSVATTGSYNDLINKPSIPRNVSDLTNDTGFITEDDLTDYALKSDIPDTSKFITSDNISTKADTSYVNEQLLLKADKAYTYTKSEVDDIIADAVAGGEIDLSGYAKTQDVDNKLSLKADISDVYTKHDIDNKSYTTLAEVSQQGYAKASDIPSLDGLVTENQLAEGLNTKQDKGDYVTTSVLNSKGYLTEYNETDPIYIADKPYIALKSEIPAIPTNISSFTNDVGYLTEHQDISGKADKATTLQGYGITNAYTQDQVNTIVKDFTKYIVTTYDELVSLKNSGSLQTGAYYRITDYVTTTNGSSANTSEPSRSAGHQFDIVIQALGPSNLSEIGTCALHEGDTYFATQNLSAWQIWYDINNDKTKYAWAVTDGTGKGVIYRMIDERQNDLPYDFKNIQFYRDASLSKYSLIADRLIASDGYYYTISDTTSGTITDFSLASNDNNNNRMDICNKNPAGGYAQTLNNNLFIQVSGSRAVQNNVFGLNNYNNTCGQTSGNKFGGYVYNNVLLQNGNNQVLYGYMNDNKLRYFAFNIVTGRFVNNTIENGFQGNFINDGFQNNTVGNGFCYNYVGQAVQYCNIGHYFYYNTIKGNSWYIKVPSASKSSRFQGYTIEPLTSGSSATNLLDLTGLPTGANYSIQLTKDVDGKVLALWRKGALTTGKYKESATATQWLDLEGV